MANLVAIAYDDLGQAQNVMGTLGELVKEHSLELEDAVIVERKQDGKIKLHQPSLGGVGAASGAIVSPSTASRISGRLTMLKNAWNNGVRDRSRSGLISSSRRSNGTSWVSQWPAVRSLPRQIFKVAVSVIAPLP